MPNHDYQCSRCGRVFEMNHTLSEMRASGCVAACACGGLAAVVYLRSPVMGNKRKGVYPYFDVQLGVTLESSEQRDRILKEKGLTMVGPGERHDNICRSTSPGEPAFDSEKFRDVCAKVTAQIEHQEIPLEPARKLDPDNASAILAPE